MDETLPDGASSDAEEPESDIEDIDDATGGLSDAPSEGTASTVTDSVDNAANEGAVDGISVDEAAVGVAGIDEDGQPAEKDISPEEIRRFRGLLHTGKCGLEET